MTFGTGTWVVAYFAKTIKTCSTNVTVTGWDVGVINALVNVTTCIVAIGFITRFALAFERTIIIDTCGNVQVTAAWVIAFVDIFATSTIRTIENCIVTIASVTCRTVTCILIFPRPLRSVRIKQC